MIYWSPLCSCYRVGAAHFSASPTVVSPSLIDMITVPKFCLWQEAGQFRATADLSSSPVLCVAEPAKNQNWCTYPGTLFWMVTHIFLPNKFIFKQEQILGFNDGAGTSSVSSLPVTSPRKSFCVEGEWKRVEKGHHTLFSSQVPVCI